MEILYLVPHIPSATKVRSYYQVLGLKNAGHQVTVATIVRSAADEERVRRLEATRVRVLWGRLSLAQAVLNSLTALAHREPMQARFMWSRALMNQIQEHCSQSPPDIIHVEHLRMAVYALQLPQEPPIIWDAVDHLGTLYDQASTLSQNLLWRLTSKIEAPLLRAYEHRLPEYFPVTLVISEKDRALFQQHTAGPERILYAPIGFPVANNPGRAERVADRIIITGNFDYHPNVAAALYFVREVFPRIVKEHPGAHLQLVGANPAPAIRRLAGPHVQVTGRVPSVTDYLRQATVAVAPVLYGSGIKIKVVEAFLAETPLVASPVALEGLDVRRGEDVLVGDDAESFAAAVLQLLKDSSLRAHLASNARHYVEQHHDLEKTTANLLRIYKQVLELNASKA